MKLLERENLSALPYAAIGLVIGIAEIAMYEIESRFPSNSELPRIGCNISVYESGCPQDPATPKALSNKADNLSAESAGTGA